MTSPTKTITVRQSGRIAAVLRTLAVGAAIAWTSATGQAWAANFPERTIKLIVPFTAGGATDIVARVMAEEFGKELGGTMIVENREGAAGVIGVQAAMRSAPDGYTLLISGNTLMTSHKTLYKNLPYDPLKDFDPVARIAAGSHILVVKADSPYKNIKDFLAAARAKPESITYGSGGNGTSVHLSGEMFQVMSGVKLMHVPYRGTSLAVTGMLGGDIESMFDTTSSAKPRIKSGQIRALGITSAKRSPELPDVPTIAEQGLPNYEVLFWLGLYAPKGTPADVLRRIEDAARKIIATERVKKRFEDVGVVPYFASGADLSKQIAKETAEWADVINKVGLKLE